MRSLHRLGALLIVTLALGAASALCRAEGEAPVDPFPPEQIEQLVAPIALYPDALIAQMLMAATYPLDVVQANRWLADHEGQEGDALQEAVDAEPWDDSVKALVFFPSVLEFMSGNLDWTQDLGDAVLAQQGDVTDAIQKLRGEAEEAGNLESNDQQRVEQDGDTIIIQPAQSEVVYVPTYDPVKTYGDSAPPANSYYPDAYADATASYDAGYAAGKAAGDTTSSSSGSSSDSLVSFGVGALTGGLLTAAIMWNNDDRYDRIYYGGRGYYGAPSYWSQPAYWNNNGWRQPNNIQVNRNVNRTRNVERGDININKGIVGNDISANRVQKWEHNPERRGSVRYRDDSTRNRFAGKRGERTIDRDTARGRPVTAPKLSEVKREGAVSGGLAKLDQGPRGSGLKDRAGDRQARAPKRHDKGQVGAKAPAVKRKAQPAQKARTKPKAKASAAAKRPVNRQAKRPDVAKAKRPARTSTHKAQGRRASGAKSQGRAFQPKKSHVSRQASHRGAASRSGSARAGARRGGGGARHGGGRRGR